MSLGLHGSSAASLTSALSNALSCIARNFLSLAHLSHPTCSERMSALSREFTAALCMYRDDAKGVHMVNRRAVEANALIPVDWLVGSKGVLPMSPLQIALRSECYATARALVDLGADLDKFNVISEPGGTSAKNCALRETAVGCAVRHSSLSLLKVLRSLGANLTLSRRVVGGQWTQWTALQDAVAGADVKLVRYLIKEAGLDADMGPDTTATLTAMYDLLRDAGGGNIETLEILIDNGFVVSELYPAYDADPPVYGITDNKTLEESWLETASCFGNKDFVRFLLNKLGFTMCGGATAFLRFLKKAGSADSWSSCSLPLTIRFGHDMDWARPQVMQRIVGNIDFLLEHCCSSCSVIGGTKLCSRCKRMRYCSIQCQRRHWSEGHKKSCA